MGIADLFKELDYLVLTHFGDLNAALITEKGQWLMAQLLADENRADLGNWYSRLTSLNSLALEVKDKLEQDSGEQLWPSPQVTKRSSTT